MRARDLREDLRLLVRQVRRFSRRRSRRPGEVYATAAFGMSVTGLHFGSMALTLYSQIWWWDLLVHGLSGLGVAAAIYVLRPRLLASPLALFVALPAVVLAVGTWFEVYERLFTDFWVSWSRAYYLEDTFVDLIADTAGAWVFGAFAYVRSRLVRPSIPTPTE
jgi:hypothetical protein